MKRCAPVLLFTSALLMGQEVGPVGGATFAKYNVSQSWETGYRWATVGGDYGKYRSDVNYRNGFRLLGSSLAVHSLDSKGSWFDEITLNTAGLGNDPYQSATFRVEKNRLYRYDMLWRSNDYFNPGLTVASGEHLQDTTQRWQDHDLTFFPQSAFRVRAGYGRNTQSGPALTTEQFDSGGNVFPLFRNIRQEYNEYRVGFDATFKGFRLTVLRRWEYFKEDSSNSVTTPEAGTPPAALTSLQASQPYRGEAPAWMGNLIGDFKWITVNARATYTGGKGDFVDNETAVGVNRFGAAQNRQIAVIGSGNRPILTGDFNFTLFPSSKLSLVNNFSVANTRMVGTNAFTQFDNATLSANTINFQYLGIRLLTDAADLRYRVSKKLELLGGVRIAERLINSIEDVATPSTPFQGLTAHQVNHTNAGVAGITWLPFAGLRMHAEGELGRNSTPFAPISLANYHSIRARTQYRHKNASLGGSYQQNYNNNSIVVTSYSSRSRNYSADASWAMTGGLSIDASYSKLHLDTIGGVAFFAPAGTLVSGLQSIYISNIHSVNVGARFAATKYADLYLGYSLTQDTGDGRNFLATQSTPAAQVFYNVQTFPLTFQTPVVRVSFRLSEKLRWNAAYQYYGYHEQFGVLSQDQNYRAHTGYTSLLWAF